MCNQSMLIPFLVGNMHDYLVGDGDVHFLFSLPLSSLTATFLCWAFFSVNHGVSSRFSENYSANLN
jgi:hypothetical protein